MPSNPDRRVKLSVATSVEFVAGRANNYRLTITASDANLMDNEVFYYRRYDSLPEYPDPVDRFQGVVDPKQMEEYPIDEPDEDLGHQYFRTDSFDELYLDAATADAAVADIVAAVNRLKDSLDYNDGLGPTTEYWVGIAP